MSDTKRYSKLPFLGLPCIFKATFSGEGGASEQLEEKVKR